MPRLERKKKEPISAKQLLLKNLSLPKDLVVHLVSLTISCWLFVPVAAYLFHAFTGKNDVVTNITYVFGFCVEFLKAGSQFFPGDFLLAAVLVLYVRKFKVSMALLAAAALTFIYTRYSGDLIANCISGLEPKSPLSMVIKSIYGGIALEFVLLKVALPAIVAFKRNKAKKKFYLWFSIFLGWLPPVWTAMVFLAFRDDKKPGENSSAAKKGDDGRKGNAVQAETPRKLSKRKLRKRKY